MTDLPALDPVEQRLLGCLLEKQVTVPATYPLTLNALRTACNQSSSRDPVMALDDQTVQIAARAVRDRGLLRIVWADTGRRVLKYHQTLDEVLGVDPAERALLTVLLLRGAQTAGELTSRTERLHPFADRQEVDACLHRLADRPNPLVRRLERRPGQQDHRWVHLLGPVPGTDGGTATATAAVTGTAAVAEPRRGHDGPPAQSGPERDQRVRDAYGAIATDYADRCATELEDLPFERWLLDRVVTEARGRPVVDAGCGPGHVTAYLAAAGADARGLDLTPELIDQARARFAGVRYDVGDLTRLIRPENADGWGAVLGWYALIHLAAAEFAAAVAALARPLTPGGVLVLAGHAGREVRRTTCWGHDLALDTVLRDPADVVAAVTAAGLERVEWYVRGALDNPDSPDSPDGGRRETTDRWYVLARSAASPPARR